MAECSKCKKKLDWMETKYGTHNNYTCAKCYLKENKKTEDSEEDLNEIKGWLAFFIATTFFSVAFQIYYTFTAAIGFFEIINGLAVSSLFLLLGIFLVKRKAYAIKFAKIFLIITLALNLLLVLTNPSEFVPNLFLYFLIWIPYLFLSKRVKVIYGSLKEQKSGLQIWPILSMVYAFIAPIYAIVFVIIGLINIGKNRKLKGMALSVISLVIGVIVFIMVMLYSSLFYAEIYIPEEIDVECSNFCYDNEDATYYYLEYDYEAEAYTCYCIDDTDEIVAEKNLPYMFESI